MNQRPQRPQRPNPPGNNPPRQGAGQQQPPPAPIEPFPWLQGVQPNPHTTASFVEYLRWLRQKTGNTTIDAGTQVQLLSKFENNDFSSALNRLTNRTKLLSNPQQGHIHFEATCPWRIRVGGTKGPESMLLPAFDNLGIPYIPSSTLRGVTRTMAAKDIGEDGAKKIFGSIDVNQGSMGKVTFLDAYPLPGKGKQGGLKPDMANSIWRWEGNNPPGYSPNPNTFLSLEKPTFIIGLRRNGCSDDEWEQVQKWLKNGLAQGVGSQVNSGYGTLEPAGKLLRKRTILSVPFELQGQLSHGRQKFTQWQPRNNGWQMRGAAVAEIRPVAFKNMLRYWFRALALGVLPAQQVRNLEVEIFGGIEPEPHTGLFRIEITDGNIVRDNARGRNDSYGLATGTLTLRNSSQTGSLPQNKKDTLLILLKYLTWLMFHLGGIGQGARRPCYSRANRQYAPWWRGAMLIPQVENDDFWRLPESIEAMARRFRENLNIFYTQLGQFAGARLDFENPLQVGQVTARDWSEVIDRNCRILCVTGGPQAAPDELKPFALGFLHRLARQGGNYDRNLCGGVQGNATPSPVWIIDFEDYQIVTIFGATQNPRSNYVQQLQQAAGQGNFAQIWPL